MAVYSFLVGVCMNDEEKGFWDYVLIGALVFIGLLFSPLAILVVIFALIGLVFSAPSLIRNSQKKRQREREWELEKQEERERETREMLIREDWDTIMKQWRKDL